MFNNQFSGGKESPDLLVHADFCGVNTSLITSFKLPNDVTEHNKLLKVRAG